MKNNLIIHPKKLFFLKDKKNIFIDFYTYSQFTGKKNKAKYFQTKDSNKYRTLSYKKTEKIFYILIDCIKNEYNKIFKKDYDIIFYEIIFGHWLRKFIEQFIFKHDSVVGAIKNCNIDYCQIFDTNNFIYAVDETHSIYSSSLDNGWNASIYSYIIENIKSNIKIKKIKIKQKIFKNLKSIQNKKSVSKNNINLKSLINFLFKLSNILPNNSTGLVYNTGFGFYHEKKFEMVLGQLPRNYNLSFKYVISNYNSNLRLNLNFKKYIINDDKNKHDSVHICNLILDILDRSIPIIFYEDFIYMLDFSLKINFPKNPKFILTSYAFETNEPFKFYLAHHKSKNKSLTYFVFQHGNSYITRIDNTYNNEVRTADKFITWGKKSDLNYKNNITHYNYKLLNLNKNYFKDNISDQILLILRSSGFNTVPYDRQLEGKKQLNLIIDFLEKIDDKLKSKIIIRAHANSKKYLNEYELFFSKFNVDFGKTPYLESVNNAKLVIFNYDSTGMLEMLSLGKPCIGLWPNLYQHLNKFSVSDYKKLKSVNILFDNSENLLKHIVTHWNNLDKWWLDKSTQKVKNEFVKNYSIRPKKDFFISLKKKIMNTVDEKKI